MSTAVTARRLPVPPRATARAKPLAPLIGRARLKLRALVPSMAANTAAEWESLTLQVGDQFDARGFNGLVIGRYQVASVSPGFTATAGGGVGGITIRLKPVPAPPPKVEKRAKPRVAANAKGKKGSSAR